MLVAYANSSQTHLDTRLSIGYPEVGTENSFRYPMKRDGAPSQSTEFGFNVYEFAKMLDPVLDGLRDWAYELDDHLHKMSGRSTSEGAW
jgi:hypothetical protein